MAIELKEFTSKLKAVQDKRKKALAAADDDALEKSATPAEPSTSLPAALEASPAAAAPASAEPDAARASLTATTGPVDAGLLQKEGEGGRRPVDQLSRALRSLELLLPEEEKTVAATGKKPN